MSELKPCPFCGNEPHIDANYHLFSCQNKDCIADATNYEATMGFFEQWNTRPIEDALTARIAELEAEVSRLLTERDDIIMAEARYTARVELAKKDTRIAELEGFIDQLIEAGNAENRLQNFEVWQALVKDWKEG